MPARYNGREGTRDRLIVRAGDAEHGDATVEAHRWTREKYEQAAAAGVFEDRRVELVDGVIYDMTPQNSPHATGIVKCAEALRAIFSFGFHVRPQLPLALGADSMPEPDFAVVAGKADDYRKAHPATAVLVVEVHRDPADGAYRSRQVLCRGERIAPLARPDADIAVEDLLPLPD